MKEITGDLRNWRFFFKEPGAEEVFQKFERAVKNSCWDCFHIFKTTTGRRRIYLFQPPNTSQRYLIKAYLSPRIFKQVKYLVRASRCQQEFIASERLTRLGFASPPALFFGYERKRFGLWGAELVLEPFWEEKNFEEIWERAEEPERKRLFEELAYLVINLHHQGVLQRDFKPDSLLVKKDPKGIKFIISDLERIKFFHFSLGLRRRINNLGKVVQAFFSLKPCPELSWFLEAYYSQAGLRIKREKFFLQVILSARKQLVKQAEQRKSWAKDTNELIERYFIQGWEVRRFKTIDAKWLEQGLKARRLKPGQSLDWLENQIKIFPAQNSRAVMETYFFLRELEIPAFQVALALSSQKGNSGLVGIIYPREAVNLREFLEKEPGKKMLLSQLGRWLFRLELFGIMPEMDPKENLFVCKEAEGNYKLMIARSDRLRIKSTLPSPKSLIPSRSGLLTQLVGQLALSREEKELVCFGFEQAKELYFI